MRMQHDAIIALNSSIVRVVTKKATGQTIAYDDKGNEVSWDADAVATKEAELIAAQKLENLRVERNLLIAETDWWAMSDTATMTDAQKTLRTATMTRAENNCRPRRTCAHGLQILITVQCHPKRALH